MMKTQILIVARDIGSVRFLAPILRELQTHYACYLLAEDVAVEGFAEYGFSVAPPPNDLPALFDRLAPCLLITGTSLQPSLENRAILEARQRGIPSVGIVDAMTNYSARLDDIETGEKLRYKPDYLAVINSYSRDLFTALGVDPASIWVTGNPHHDQVLNYQASQDRAAVLADLDLPPAAQVILFVSEPLPDRWYAEFAQGCPSAQDIENALRLCQATLAPYPNAHLVVKTHPIEDPALVQSLLVGSAVPYRIVHKYNPLDLALAADLILGISSNLLIETCLLNLPTYSFLNYCATFSPHLSATSSDPHLGTISQAQDLAMLLAGLQKGRLAAAVPATDPPRQAVQNFVQQVQKLCQLA